ncbi:hypothetical protein [Salisediminibacterium beveridgei]|uniref:hypothetical protein n=1 Tax=Salisediminibacterium beveridgei TaxID=632773 RepID=UPI0012EDAEF4|nr:hypothetical protein [Salisediminibacterium beveridgei]
MGFTRRSVLAVMVLLLSWPVAVKADDGFASGLPVPWYWLVFAGAMVSSAGIVIYRRNTKVYKD